MAVNDRLRSPLTAAASLLWAAAWRAQLAHAAIFVVAPVLLGLGMLAVAIVFMPFFLVGEGAVNRTAGPDVSHLRDPHCWVVVAPCPLADRPVPGMPQWARPADPAVSPGPEPFWEWPDVLTWRHVWFATWLAWFLAYCVRRERRSPQQ